MYRASRVGVVSLAILGAAGLPTANADVWERLIPFSFRVAPARPKNVNVNSDPLLDAAKIKAGLRTATPEEHGFVERAVDMAKRGKLPPDILESTFQWARKKPDEFRFQYFKRALTARAAKVGITIESSGSEPVAHSKENGSAKWSGFPIWRKD